jgi:hypothetical protein
MTEQKLRECLAKSEKMTDKILRMSDKIKNDLVTIACMTILKKC